MSAMARWCFRHRVMVLGLWAALVLALGGLVSTVGTSYSEEFSLPGQESTRAFELLEKSMPAAAGDTSRIVVHVERGSVSDAAVRAKVGAMLQKVSTLPSITSVTGPYVPEGAAQISPDGRTAYASVQFDAVGNEVPREDVQKVIDTAQAARGDGLRVELSGEAIAGVTQAPPGSSELIGVAAAAVILFLAFGSLLGMVLPLVVAAAGVGSGLLGIALLSHAISLTSVTPTLASLIGLGVGIDYALFIVTRFRTGLQAGLEPEESAIHAVNTSGRAVLFAGATVVIALLGLLVLNLNFLAGMGIGSAVAVGFTVASAITLTPAMLGFFGHRLISKAQKEKLATEGPRVVDGTSGFWGRWAVFVERHKAVLCTVVVLIIALMSVPTFSVRLGASDDGNDKAGSTTREAYDLLAAGFGPGSNGTLQLVAEVPDAASGQAFDRLVANAATVPGVAAVQPVPAQPGATVRIAVLVPTTAPQDERTDKLIDRLREDVVPSAEAGTALQVHVGGVTAVYKDFAQVLWDKLPLFLGVIILLGCVLLLVAFRSIMVPLTAAVMNVIAAAASFGVIVAVFQWGWGEGIIDIGGPGPVEAYVPEIMLAILFGLSMDYQVFLVSRMHEEWLHTRDNERAVRVGQAETGRVITAAALIMMFVFGAFVLEGERVIAEFGVGLAAAVAIDAFLLRTVLVPAAMHLLGNSNWWLPAWLDRILPHISVEGPGDDDLSRPAGTPPSPRSGDSRADEPSMTSRSS